mmetsp:Transcript_941/g.1699  ORF Transcript_941/g.1699 Transcript_941/m.1699 type:complete len:569 (+) Transcript_941:34-1740(+)
MGMFGKKKSSDEASNAPATQYSAASDYEPPVEDTTVGPIEIVETSQTLPMTSPKASVVQTQGSDGSDNSKKKALLGQEDPEEGDVDGVYKPEAEKPMKEKLMENATAFWASVLGCCGFSTLPKLAKVTIMVGAGIGLFAGALTFLLLSGGDAPIYQGKVNVAFIGNSYFYVNDLPRFVENIAGGHIFQDSCLHPSSSILEIIMTGNGMWTRWATKNAMIGGVKYETQDGDTAYLYDMGACSVPQLLTGHDKLVTSGDALGSFINDGENPCFQEDAYLQYQESFDYKGTWDFVVLTDQAKRMCFDETRHEALAAFNYTYGPILKKRRITPIIVQPHAYQSQNVNASGLGDLDTFTALTMEGAHVYKNYLNKRLGWFTHAQIAPVGNAFLAVKESDSSLYQKLFLDDGIHPSAFGTYLYGLVIYATMMGYMPKYKDVVVDDVEDELFATARKLQAADASAGFPDKDEAAALFKIAKKVALRGYQPQALRGFNPSVSANEYIDSSVSSGSYEGEDYTVDVYGGQNQYNSYGYGGSYANAQYGGSYNGQYGGNYGNNNGGNYNGQYGGNYGQ